MSEKSRSVDEKKGLSKVGGHEEKTREGSSTPNLETSAVTDHHKIEKTDGGGELTRVATNKGTE